MDILGRLIADEHFRNAVFKDPETTLRSLGVKDPEKLKAAQAFLGLVQQAGVDKSLHHLKTLDSVSQ